MHIARKWHSIIDGYEKAQQIVNGLEWNITARPRQNGEWALFAGDQEIGTFSNRSEMEAFVTGMGLALGALPDEVIQRIKKIIE